MEKRKCAQCGEAFILKRNPRQCYCNSPLCQSARKNVWRKDKHKNDSDYRENKKHANQRWSKKNQGYWRKYRGSHPEYSLRNRRQQKARDKKRTNLVNNNVSTLAKSDTLNEKMLIKSGTYILIPDLAKSDALTVKISLIT